MNRNWWRLVAFFAFCAGLTRGGAVEIITTVKLPEEEVDVLPLTADQENPYFKILNELDGKIYIGGKRLVVVFDPNTDIKDSKIINFENGELNNIISCSTIAPEGEKDKICQHYIRVAERIGPANSTKFLFCGTNLLEPYCHLLNMSADQTFATIGNFSAPRKVQYSVVQNSTSLYHDQSERLFTGYNIEGRPNPSHIAKYQVEDNGLNEIAATDDQNENLVNEPDFVGKPYVHDGFIYFFYRETAVEAVNQGKFVYSRVGRLCLDDNGHNKEIQTFFKARLNCSLQGEYPFYFNHIQDVIVEENEESVIFHAVFTTTPHGPSSSAVCSYLLGDIIKVFENSQFKGKTPGKLPGPVTPIDVDKNKFLKCDVGSLDNDERDFQEVNTLMDDLIPNHNPVDSRGDSHPPLLYSTRMNFYSIAVDHTNADDKIYYIGTEYGTILKAYFDDANILRTYEMEMLNINRPVTGLRYNNRKLLAVTEKGLYQIDLARCESSGCSAECNGFRHGYCQDNNTNRCSPTVSTTPTQGEATTYTSSKAQILTYESNEIITSCANRYVELTCEVKNTSPLCGKVELFWRRGDETLVICTKAGVCEGTFSAIAPFFQYQVISNQPDYKLVHLTVKVFNETKGEFSCSPGKEGEAKVIVDVDNSRGCLTEESYNERRSTRNDLEEENKVLTKCEAKYDPSAIMFQDCAKCPGDPRVNNP